MASFMRIYSPYSHALPPIKVDHSGQLDHSFLITEPFYVASMHPVLTSGISISFCVENWHYYMAIYVSTSRNANKMLLAFLVKLVYSNYQMHSLILLFK